VGDVIAHKNAPRANLEALLSYSPPIHIARMFPAYSAISMVIWLVLLTPSRTIVLRISGRGKSDR
jgi:hypothetical protein